MSHAGPTFEPDTGPTPAHGVPPHENDRLRTPREGCGGPTRTVLTRHRSWGRLPAIDVAVFACDGEAYPGTEAAAEGVAGQPVTLWLCRCAVACTIGIAFWIAVVLDPYPGQTRSDNLVGSAVFLGFALIAWRFGIYPRLIATNWGLIVRNPVFSRHVPWSQVVDVSPGQSGLFIERARGMAVSAWFAQQGAISVAGPGGRTRSEQIMDEVRELAALHGAHSASTWRVDKLNAPRLNHAPRLAGVTRK